MSTAPRIQTPERLVDEDELDRSLRPRRLQDFVGQPSLKEQLAISIEAAQARGEALDHVLLAGPPGLGKTTLAQIVAAELDVPFVQTAGPALERKADIAAFLTALEPRSVFFVDEIHRLQRALEETFYPAMEDRQLPITVGVGAGARVVTLDLPPFTLVGATTRTGLLTAPLRDRFGLQHRLEHYAIDDLATIVTRSAQILDVALEPAGALAIAGRSRGTPRVANRLLKRVRDYAEVRCGGIVSAARRRCRAGDARDRRPRPRPPGPRAAAGAVPEVRGRPGRPVDARGDGGGGAGHDRGRLRALPAAVRPAQAHAARADGDAARVRAHRPASRRRARPRACSDVSRRKHRSYESEHAYDRRWSPCDRSRMMLTGAALTAALAVAATPAGGAAKPRHLSAQAARRDREGAERRRVRRHHAAELAGRRRAQQGRKRVDQVVIGLDMTCTSGDSFGTSDGFQALKLSKRGRFSMSFGPRADRRGRSSRRRREQGHRPASKNRASVRGVWSLKITLYDPTGTTVLDTCESGLVSWTASQ